MARPITTTKRAGGLTFADVPVELRPSALAEVSETPTTEDEKDIAYWREGWEPNPYSSAAEQAEFDPGEPEPRWREEVAHRRQTRLENAYADWLVDKGVANSRGRIPPEWSWSEFERWEAAQCAS